MKFNKIVRIGAARVGEGHPCFIIAEAGSNHNQKLAWARKLIDVAAQAEANAVKFQTFVPEKIYVKTAGFADYLGKAKTIQEIFREIMMPPGWVPVLARHCRQRGILFMTSVFDEESADLVDPHVLAHKIASYECTHLPLIRHIARKQKPMVVSTAMASLDEIGAALDTIASTGNRNVVLMHCVAKYPAPLAVSNLRAIDTLRREYRVPVGLSDHSEDAVLNPAAVVARGGNLIEKHFTLSRQSAGPDHRFSIEPDELRELVSAVRAVESALGDGRKGVLPLERELFRFARRHVHAIREIVKGEVLTRSNTAVLRSGKSRPGVDPSEYERVLGKRAARAVREGDGIRRVDVAW
jgi:N-acetylneuraminate synthase